MTIRRTIGLAAALCALGAAATGVARDSATADHMHEHYDAVLSIQAAVIAGALEDTREPAKWLLEHETPAGLPAGSAEYVEAMRKAAGDVLAASDLATAATATSQLGVACGSCHTANEVTVEFEPASQPSYDEKTRPHMQRHQWAADRMWEGLIGPSDYAWSRGGNLLFESPIRDVDHAGEDAEWKGMARRIHQLAANATTVHEIDKKAAIYAEFLANCAACHQKLDKGPQH